MFTERENWEVWRGGSDAEGCSTSGLCLAPCCPPRRGFPAGLLLARAAGGAPRLTAGRGLSPLPRCAPTSGAATATRAGSRPTAAGGAPRWAAGPTAARGRRSAVSPAAGPGATAAPQPLRHRIRAPFSPRQDPRRCGTRLGPGRCSPPASCRPRWPWPRCCCCSAGRRGGGAGCGGGNKRTFTNQERPRQRLRLSAGPLPGGGRHGAAPGAAGRDAGGEP